MKSARNISLAMIAGLAVFVGCQGDASNKEQSDNKEVEEQKEQKSSERNPKSDVKFAYYVQDSLATQFEFYREIDSMLKSKEKAFQNELESRIRSYKKYEADIQKRMDNNEITGYQLDEIQETAMRKQESIQQFEQQRGAELQQESFEYQTALMNKISEYGREFSEENDIDMLFFYQKGGQITYIHDAFNMTDQFIDFLNQKEEELTSGFDEEMESVNEEQGLNSLGGGMPQTQ
ncbi:MAG: OmpH family outer membrane protein [Bacteroidota bacterium]